MLQVPEEVIHRGNIPRQHSISGDHKGGESLLQEQTTAIPCLLKVGTTEFIPSLPVYKHEQ